MAQRVVLHYFPGKSFLHHWDARCRLLGLLMITASLFQAKILWLIFDSCILIGVLIFSRLPIRQFLRDFRTWMVFLFVLFIFQAFFAPGSRLSSIPWLPLSKEGLHLGGLTCWRLGLILSYGVVFSAVTRPRELRDTVIWFLTPIPFLPERRIGLMVSLTLRFFSLILDQFEEVHLAYKARLGDRSRNPVRKAKSLALPLLSRAFSQAEEIALALAARGYREDIPLRLPKMKPFHPIPLLILLGFFILAWSYF